MSSDCPTSHTEHIVEETNDIGPYQSLINYLTAFLIPVSPLTPTPTLESFITS